MAINLRDLADPCVADMKKKSEELLAKARSLADVTRLRGTAAER